MYWCDPVNTVSVNIVGPCEGTFSLFRGRFLQVRWPIKQRQSTDRSQLVVKVSDHVTRLKLSMGPIRARIAYTRAMSEHRCFPKKRLSTHTMHFIWHQRNLSKNDHESLETNHEWRHTFIINVKRKVTISLRPVYKVDMHNDRQSQATPPCYNNTQWVSEWAEV